MRGGIAEMSFRAVSSLSRDTDSEQAGVAVARNIAGGFGGDRPKVVIVYATVNHDQPALLRGVREVVGPEVTVLGCSGQGVMGNGTVDEGGFVLGAMGLGGPELRVAAARADRVQVDTARKGNGMAQAIEAQLGEPARLMLLMYDPLCGIDVNELLAGVQRESGAPVVGAAAGQPAGPSAGTYQYFGAEAFSQGGVALGLAGDFAVDIGVSHGTTPTGVAMTLTRAEGNKLIELDGRPALEVWRESVGCSEDDLYNQDHSSGLAMGIERRVQSDGREEAVYLIRAAFGFDSKSGSIVVQAAIPEGSKIMFHHRTVPVVRDGAVAMGRDLAARLSGRDPWAVLGFECGARTGPFLGASETLQENLLLQETVAPRAPWLGLIGWGEIAPCGGVPEFHNYTYPLVVLS
jgi:hypothetical protein